MKHFKKIILSALLVLLAFIAIGGEVLYNKTYQPSASAQAISQKAQKTNDYLYFGASGTAKGNILFYQGALVEENSYAPIAQGLSEQGYDVYVLKTPLNLPVLSSQKALTLIKSKKMTNVYLAGHSLGGVIASMNADQSSAIKGLILLASYPSEKTDLSDSDLNILSITASKDKVLKWSNYKAAKKRLPDNTQYITIKGGNHSGFGSYGQQEGDGKAILSSEQQNQKVVAIISDFLNNIKNTSEN